MRGSLFYINEAPNGTDIRAQKPRMPTAVPSSERWHHHLSDAITASLGSSVTHSAKTAPHWRRSMTFRLANDAKNGVCRECKADYSTAAHPAAPKRRRNDAFRSPSDASQRCISDNTVAYSNAPKTIIAKRRRGQRRMPKWRWGLNGVAGTPTTAPKSALLTGVPRRWCQNNATVMPKRRLDGVIDRE